MSHSHEPEFLVRICAKLERDNVGGVELSCMKNECMRWGLTTIIIQSSRADHCTNSSFYLYPKTRLSFPFSFCFLFFADINLYAYNGKYFYFYFLLSCGFSLLVLNYQ